MIAQQYNGVRRIMCLHRADLSQQGQSVVRAIAIDVVAKKYRDCFGVHELYLAQSGQGSKLTMRVT